MKSSKNTSNNITGLIMISCQCSSRSALCVILGFLLRCMCFIPHYFLHFTFLKIYLYVILFCLLTIFFDSILCSHSFAHYSVPLLLSMPLKLCKSCGIIFKNYLLQQPIRNTLHHICEICLKI